MFPPMIAAHTELAGRLEPGPMAAAVPMAGAHAKGGAGGSDPEARLRQLEARASASPSSLPSPSFLQGPSQGSKGVPSSPLGVAAMVAAVQAGRREEAQAAAGWGGIAPTESDGVIKLDLLHALWDEGELPEMGPAKKHRGSDLEQTDAAGWPSTWGEGLIFK